MKTKQEDGFMEVGWRQQTSFPLFGRLQALFPGFNDKKKNQLSKTWPVAFYFPTILDSIWSRPYIVGEDWI